MEYRAGLTFYDGTVWSLWSPKREPETSFGKSGHVGLLDCKVYYYWSLSLIPAQVVVGEVARPWSRGPRTESQITGKGPN